MELFFAKSDITMILYLFWEIPYNFAATIICEMVKDFVHNLASVTMKWNEKIELWAVTYSQDDILRDILKIIQ